MTTLATIFSAILTICKAIPAVERMVAQFVEFYSNAKKEKNAADEKAKNSRDDADIDRIASGMPKLCPTCPFASKGTGQHGGTEKAP